MSLVSTASIWTNDDISTKKRQPSMARKTVKVKPASYNSEYDEYNQTQDKNEYVLKDIDDVQKMNEDRNQKVNDIINKMSSISTENDGAKLADFNPPPKPSIQLKKDLQTGWVKPDEKIPDLANPLQMPAPSFANAKSVNPYIVNNANAIGLGNYQQVYDPANVEYKPYYSKMGLGASGSIDSKLMEKINYMIHLLENQENEKTSNITEEFILYTFLGVFVIFVLDSFSRSGKYVR
jgi:hypothetical protein